MSVDPLSFFKGWEGFLSPDAVVMAKRWVSAPMTASETAPDPQEVMLGIEAPGFEDQVAKALLEKILAALEMNPKDVVVFRTRPVGFKGPVIIRFVAQEDGPEVGVWKEETLLTYSLEAMLKDSALKKIVWAHLKGVLPKIRSSSGRMI